MTDLDVVLQHTRKPPYAHQVVGVKALLDNKIFALFDEMGAGKTKQTIDAAQGLMCAGQLDRVIVVAPASVRGVWYDPELGELAKHLWDGLSATVVEYHAKQRSWDHGKPNELSPTWIITNYDFIRPTTRLKKLLELANKKTLLVLDESSAVKNYRALQTKACWELRQKCGRIVLLNGTPIENNPGDIFSQARMLDPAILACPTWFHFRARYGVLGGFKGKQVIGWTHLDDLQARLKPYVLRRLKVDCLDLPPKLPSVTLTCTLSQETWAVYKDLRDQLVVWLNSDSVVTAPQAIVKIIRLAQVTSGFLTGVEYGEEPLDAWDLTEEERPAWLPDEVKGRANEPNPGRLVDLGDQPFPALGMPASPASSSARVSPATTWTLGAEKVNAVCDWLGEQLEVDPNLKVLAWCRFRPELGRLAAAFELRFPQLTVGKIWGGQKRAEREESVRLLDPRTAPPGPVVVLGTPSSGAKGLNLTGAHTVIYVSNDYRYGTRQQSEDRVHRPGQTYPVSYFDVVAEGPQGQKTIDHKILAALLSKQDLAVQTTSAWVQLLREE